MSAIRARWAWAALLSLVAAGCARTTPPSHQPAPPAAEPQPAADGAAQHASELDQAVRQLQADSARLPGGSEAEHRQIMQQVFADVSHALTLLSGPEEYVVHRQVLNIDQSRAQLASISADVPAEPTIDTGLRSAYTALSDLAGTREFQQTDLAGMLGQLRGQIDRLDLDRGPLHQVDVANAVDSMARIIQKMAAAQHPAAAAPAPTTNPA